MTEEQFRQQIPDEAAAQKFLESLRWGERPRCPSCGRPEGVLPDIPGWLRCRDCRNRFNVKTGTIMSHTMMPLDKWLLAALLVSQERQQEPLSINAMTQRLGVSRMTGLSTLKRVRQVCGNLKGRELATLARRLLKTPHALLLTSERRREKRDQ